MFHASTRTKVTRLFAALAGVVTMLLASPVFAQSNTSVTDTLISKFGTYIVDPLLLVIFAAGFFMFMWGLLQFMINSSNSESTAEGQKHMIYGTLGMFIMVSVYGIISLLDSTFGLNVSNPTVNTNINVPTASFVGGN